MKRYWLLLTLCLLAGAVRAEEKFSDSVRNMSLTTPTGNEYLVVVPQAAGSPPHKITVPSLIGAQTGLSLVSPVVTGTFTVNGVGYTFPTTASIGNILGPSTSTATHIPVFNNTTGTLISQPTNGPTINATTGRLTVARNLLVQGTAGDPGLTSVININAADGEGIGNAATLTNNMAAGNWTYPAAWTGYGINNQVGGQVFGLFARADLNVHGSAVNEFNSFNYAGAFSGNLPADTSFGTTDNIGIALQVVAFGNYPSAVGVNVRYGSQPFYAGIVVDRSSSSDYGMLIDAAAATGPAVGARIQTKATGVPLQLQMLGSPSPSARMLILLNPAGNAEVASIDASGSFGNPKMQMGSDGILYFITPNLTTSASGGAATALPALPQGYLTVSISGTTRKIPYYAN